MEMNPEVPDSIGKKESTNMRVLSIVMLTLVPMVFSKSASDIPVTSTLADVNAANVPYYVQSDGHGAYTDANNVISILVANGYNGITWGDWRLELDLQTIRTIGVTFSQTNAVQPGDPNYTAPANPPYFGTGFETAKFQNQCTADKLDMLTMKAGDKFNCSAIIKFPGATTFYRLEMATEPNEPETEKVQVSCNSANSSGCNDWFIDPIPGVNGPGQTCARLDLVDTHGKGSLTNEGDFYLTFHIHVTRP
jgi:hypothetical protein